MISGNTACGTQLTDYISGAHKRHGAAMSKSVLLRGRDVTYLGPRVGVSREGRQGWGTGGRGEEWKRSLKKRGHAKWIREIMVTPFLSASHFSYPCHPLPSSPYQETILYTTTFHFLSSPPCQDYNKHSTYLHIHSVIPLSFPLPTSTPIPWHTSFPCKLLSSPCQQYALYTKNHKLLRTVIHFHFVLPAKHQRQWTLILQPKPGYQSTLRNSVPMAIKYVVIGVY